MRIFVYWWVVDTKAPTGLCDASDSCSISAPACLPPAYWSLSCLACTSNHPSLSSNNCSAEPSRGPTVSPEAAGRATQAGRRSLTDTPTAVRRMKVALRHHNAIQHRFHVPTRTAKCTPLLWKEIWGIITHERVIQVQLTSRPTVYFGYCDGHTTSGTEQNVSLTSQWPVCLGKPFQG